MSNLAKVLKSDIAIDMTVNKDDVVAIAVSRQEDSLKRESAELQTEVRDIKKRIADDNKIISDMIRKAIGKRHSDYPMKTELTNHGFNVAFETGNWEWKNKDHEKYTYTLTLREVGTENWRAGSISVTHEVACTQEILDLNRDIECYEEDLEKIQTEWAEVKKKLNDLPSIERKAKASLAEQALGMTEGGEEILAQVNKALPYWESK